MTINDWRARYLALEQRHQEAVELLRELREARLRDEELRLSLRVVEWLAKEKKQCG